MDTQQKEAHKDMYKETTEEIAKGNSSEGQAISPPCLLYTSRCV